jgi:hypothetical protein
LKNAVTQEPKMSNLDELERRKRELELRKDIARLERQEKVQQHVSDLTSATAKKLAEGKSYFSGWFGSARMYVDVSIFIFVIVTIYILAGGSL